MKHRSADRGATPDDQVNLCSDDDVAKWCERLSVSSQELAGAIQLVGFSAVDVERLLRTARSQGTAAQR